MAINVKCPKCGSTKVQLSNEIKKRGCFWFLIFGLWYACWVMVKWTIGFMLLILYDWWMAIIKSSQKKGYVWQSKRWFSGRSKIYYCHDCGYNFRA